MSGTLAPQKTEDRAARMCVKVFQYQKESREIINTKDIEIKMRLYEDSGSIV